LVLVTGASGQIGSRLTARLRAAGHEVLAVALDASPHAGITQCDFTKHDQITQVFASHSIHTVVHLAAVLPTAFRADPIAAAEVNLIGTLHLVREAVERGVKRFVFASSLSVYGERPTSRALSERDAAAPDEPYGAAKRVVELIGESLASTGFSFGTLRIARVVGPGATSPASAWRSAMFETSGSSDEGPITLPFAPTARLSLVHVDEVARMLQLLVEAAALPHSTYNAPAEVWEAQHLAHLVERVRKVRVRMGLAEGGPVADGALFAQDFGFRLEGLTDYFSVPRPSTGRRPCV
jgi:nucleoside-diphosphate-sugar epimerase